MSENTVRHHFEQDVDTLFALVTDPGFLRRRAEAAGELEVVVEIDRDGPQLKIRITREVEQNLPSFMKKLFSPRNRLIDTQLWNTDGPAKTSDWTVQMGDRTRVQLSGRLSLAPGPTGGCDYSETFTATANIPLVGGRIAKYAMGECEKTIELGPRKPIALGSALRSVVGLRLDWESGSVLDLLEVQSQADDLVTNAGPGREGRSIELDFGRAAKPRRQAGQEGNWLQGGSSALR